MTIARSVLVPAETSGRYHCISRCVRRAYLCGDGYNHRRAWIRDRLETLTRIFAINVGSYAIMANHLHLVVRTEPGRVEQWSDEQVAERWLTLFPGRWTSGPTRGTAATTVPAEAVRCLAADPRRISVLRGRLRDLGWFMKCLKEPIARRANREDACTGHFWEGRYKSSALLDDAAVLACCVYVDLNPIRAKVTTSLEASDYTSVQERIRGRERRRSSRRRRRQSRSGLGAVSLTMAGRPSGVHGRWLLPIGTGQRRSHAGEDDAGSCGPRHGLLPISFDEYLEVVRATGRVHRHEHSRSMPVRAERVLDRLEIDVGRWLGAMRAKVTSYGTAMGSVERRVEEAARRGVRRVHGALNVHRVAACGSG